MPVWRDDPDRAADELIVTSLPDLDLLQPEDARVVVVDGGAGLRRAIFDERAYTGSVVARRASELDPQPHDRPPAESIGTFRLAFLRLPKSKEELDFAVHRLIGWMAPHGRIYIYGGNDEGMRSVAKRLAGLYTDIETVAAHSHGRILRLHRPAELSAIRADDRQWRRVQTLDLGDGTLRPWVSYPGLFAGGGLDTATALLLAHLPPLGEASSALDFGCGTGVIARALTERAPALRVTALDADTFALAATAENAPAANLRLGYRLKDTGRHDLIVSNPPIHTGIREDYTTLHRLIEDAPMHLRPAGRLLLVVQRRVPVERQLAAHFEAVEIVADAASFRVWSASRPMRRNATRTTGTAEADDDIEIP